MAGKATYAVTLYDVAFAAAGLLLSKTRPEGIVLLNDTPHFDWIASQSETLVVVSCSQPSKRAKTHKLASQPNGLDICMFKTSSVQSWQSVAGGSSMIDVSEEDVEF